MDEIPKWLFSDREWLDAVFNLSNASILFNRLLIRVDENFEVAEMGFSLIEKGFFHTRLINTFPPYSRG